MLLKDVPLETPYEWGGDVQPLEATLLSTLYGASGNTLGSAPLSSVWPPEMWLPAPPESYVATGIITTSQIDTIAGTDPLYSLFSPTHQHIVQNQNGIFAVYSYTSTGHNPEYWRLKRSIDNGATWTTIYTSTSDATYGNVSSSPAIETDAAGNIYVITQPNNGGAWINGPARWYKWSASDNYTTLNAQTIAKPIGSKFSTVYDQTRNWLWVCIWQLYGANGTTLYALDQNGSVVKSVTLWGVSGNGGAGWYFLHYPTLTITSNGTLIIGITTTDRILNDNIGSIYPAPIQNYYDSRWIYSTDGGTTFRGLSGQITLPVDPTSESVNNPMFQLVDTADAAEFIAHDAPLYGSNQAHANWNMLLSLAYNSGKLHAFYSSAAAQPTYHNDYARVDWTTKSVDKRLKPFDANISSGASGNFAQDTSQASRLYFVAPGTGGTWGQIRAYKSDDGGSTWSLYGSLNLGVGMEYLNVHRWVQSDGSIIGTLFRPDDNTVRFFRVTPN